MLIVTVLYIISNILLSACYFTTGALSFILCFLGTMLFGFGYSIGEITVFGYLKSIPMSMNKAFSAGTGISPILEGLFYTALSNCGISVEYVGVFIDLSVQLTISSYHLYCVRHYRSKTTNYPGQ